MITLLPDIGKLFYCYLISSPFCFADIWIIANGYLILKMTNAANGSSFCCSIPQNSFFWGGGPKKFVLSLYHLKLTAGFRPCMRVDCVITDVIMYSSALLESLKSTQSRKDIVLTYASTCRVVHPSQLVLLILHYFVHFVFHTALILLVGWGGI